MWTISLLALIAFGISVLGGVFVWKTAHRHGLLDRGNERTVHDRPTPRLGGVAIMAAFSVAAVLYLFLNGLASPANLGLLGALALIAAMGVVDDLRGLGPSQKLAVEVVAAVLFLATNGIALAPSWLTGWNPVLAQVLVGVASFFWIVGIMNAVNLIDGVDTLASGTVIVTAVALGTTTAILGNSADAALLILLAVSVIGFLPLNVPLPRARMFMGDTGALSLGFLVAAFSMRVSFQQTASVSLYLLPFILLSLPIFDTLAAIVRRRGRWSSADREHIHHRLLKRGWSTPHVAGILAVGNALFATLAVLTALQPFPWMAVGLAVLSQCVWWSFYTGVFLYSPLHAIQRYRLSASQGRN